MGKPKVSVTTEALKNAAHEVTEGAIIVRHEGKLYIVDASLGNRLEASRPSRRGRLGTGCRHSPGPPGFPLAFLRAVKWSAERTSAWTAVLASASSWQPGSRRLPGGVGLGCDRR
jgi:hypothetical protein